MYEIHTDFHDIPTGNLSIPNEIHEILKYLMIKPFEIICFLWGSIFVDLRIDLSPACHREVTKNTQQQKNNSMVLTKVIV